MLFSGDFRQILPVVRKGSRVTIVHLCLKSSLLFPTLRILRLTQNMRLEALRKDPNAEKEALSYPDYLLKVGARRMNVNENELTPLPESVNTVQSSTELIDSVFGDLRFKRSDVEWLTSRSILAPTNKRA